MSLKKQNSAYLSIESAIEECRQVDKEESRERAIAKRRAPIRPVLNWANKTPLPVRGRARETLRALAWLCGKDRGNGAERWRCEPRIESLAKRLDCNERTVRRHLDEFEDAGIILRVEIPNRRRRGGVSLYAVYLCVDGVEAAECAAENDGLLTFQEPANDAPETRKKPVFPAYARPDIFTGPLKEPTVPRYIAPRSNTPSARDGRSPDRVMGYQDRFIGFSGSQTTRRHQKPTPAIRPAPSQNRFAQLVRLLLGNGRGANV